MLGTLAQSALENRPVLDASGSLMALIIRDSFEKDPSSMIVPLCKHFGHCRVGASPGDVAYSVFAPIEWARCIVSHAATKCCFVVPDSAMTVHQANSPSPEWDCGVAHEFCADVRVGVSPDRVPCIKIDSVLVRVTHLVLFVHM